MGAARRDVVVGLQGALLGAARDFGRDASFAPFESRALATAASLDYVLMLASGTVGVRIPKRDAERAIHEGILRAVDDLIAIARALAQTGTPAGIRFAHATATLLRDVVRDEGLADDARSFALIALANA